MIAKNAVCGGCSPNDVQEMLAETLRGNSNAFGQVVLTYQDRLYRMMVQYTGNLEEARDVVQEAFIRAFQKLPAFRGDSAFFTWLCRIAFNLAVNHCRRWNRRHISLVYGEEDRGHELACPQPGPLACLERSERCGQVQQAIATLDAQHRAVLVLREIEGCDYQAIAQTLGLPVGTVRSRLHRARRQLREELKQRLPSED
jgi:RNA polymerase sigma-70 factor (ECF subfamily)